MIHRFGKAVFLIGLLFAGVLPVIYLVLGNESINLETIRQLSWHADTFALSFETAKFACLTAFVATLAGWLLSHHLQSSNRPYLWLAAYILCLITSPYIAAQGWIQILGNNGSLWKVVGASTAPDFIYTRSGMLFLVCLQFIPLALLIFTITAKPVSREMTNLENLTQPSLFKRIYFFHFLSRKAPLIFSFILIFWLTFWNYETPSILRLNTYALTVYAAFGSFYDYNQALGYLFHTVIYGLPALLAILWIGSTLSGNIRSLAPSNNPSDTALKRSFLFILLSIIPVLGILIPLIGLFSDIGGLQSLSTISSAARNYTNDIKNTLIVAATATSITLFISLLCVFISSKLKARNALSLSSIVLLIIPPLCTGIGMVHWFSAHSQGEVGIERIILANVFVLLPLLILPASLAFPKDSIAHSDTHQLYHISHFQKLKLLIRPVFLPRCLLLFGFGFLMVIREVPASLLNYPPDGSTIALTIETMLHFDQPKIISALCLIQLTLSIIVFLIIALLYRLCKR